MSIQRYGRRRRRVWLRSFVTFAPATLGALWLQARYPGIVGCLALLLVGYAAGWFEER